MLCTDTIFPTYKFNRPMMLQYQAPIVFQYFSLSLVFPLVVFKIMCRYAYQYILLNDFNIYMLVKLQYGANNVPIC